jgi:hypothetical protein
MAIAPAISHRCQFRRFLPVGVWIVFLASVGFSAQSASVSSFQDPADLVRKAVNNEIRAAAENAHFLFRGVKTTPQGSTTRIYVEAKDVTAGLVVAYNGQPLTAAQHQGEEARVARFKNPDEMKKKREQEHENTERTLRIIRAIPDAFLFEYAGEETATGSVGRPGARLVKLKFRPNPHYQPPSHVEEVLTGMQGFVLLDADHYRIASIDSTLYKEVSFGWGILGHLDRGGHFMIQQQEVGNNVWEISSMSLRFTGKILLVKTLNINSTEVFSGFRRVPSDMTFDQGIELLKQEAADAGNPAGLAH